ncbi:MAG TPA: molybdopterin dinucleotide binding domain-containing protein, partial [Holophaga sp.]|nr:molybdopterin dinucleotide binding domain-containing protein [Holophaga sp.]
SLEALNAGIPVELSAPPPGRWDTPSGRIELLNPKLDPPLPDYRERHAEQPALPFSLMTAPSMYGLNSSFHEQERLRTLAKGMLLLMNPDDAAARGLRDGQPVVARNEWGEVDFQLSLTPKVPPAVVVAEGVWWTRFAPGARTVNALTSQRLTDLGGGSTFYDNRVEVVPA